MARQPISKYDVTVLIYTYCHSVIINGDFFYFQKYLSLGGKK